MQANYYIYKLRSTNYFSIKSSGIRSWKEIDGLFGFPITAVNNLVTIPTTATSAKPVIIAIGNILRKDLRLLIDKQFRSLQKSPTVLLDFNILY